MRRLSVALALGLTGFLVTSGAPAGAVTQSVPKLSRALTPGWHIEGYPGAQQTFFFAISPSDAMFGQYEAKNGALDGLVFANGKWRSVVDPSAGPKGQTVTEGETSSGTLVGDYETAAGFWYGFTETKGVFKTIKDPQAQTTPGHGGGTVIGGVSPSGEMVGIYYRLLTGAHGFTDVKGQFTTVDYHAPGVKVYYTLCTAVSSDGLVVGSYYASSGYKAFIYNKGHFTSLTDPLQPKGGATQIVGIAPTSGEQVGGWWKDAATGGHSYGFIHDHGKWTALNESHGTEGTVPQGVTDTGIVDGYYTNGHGVSYGFVYVP